MLYYRGRGEKKAQRGRRSEKELERLSILLLLNTYLVFCLICHISRQINLVSMYVCIYRLIHSSNLLIHSLSHSSTPLFTHSLAPSLPPSLIPTLYLTLQRWEDIFSTFSVTCWCWIEAVPTRSSSPSPPLYSTSPVRSGLKPVRRWYHDSVILFFLPVFFIFHVRYTYIHTIYVTESSILNRARGDVYIQLGIALYHI